MPPFDREAARAKLEASLGKKVEEVFDEFESEPIAAASLGQVSRRRRRRRRRRLGARVGLPGWRRSQRAFVEEGRGWVEGGSARNGRGTQGDYTEPAGTPTAAAAAAAASSSRRRRLQVHLAKLRGGQRVVVKVQRPGLKDLFDIDLKNIRALAVWLQVRRWRAGGRAEGAGVHPRGWGVGRKVE